MLGDLAVQILERLPVARPPIPVVVLGVVDGGVVGLVIDIAPTLLDLIVVVVIIKCRVNGVKIAVAGYGAVGICRLGTVRRVVRGTEACPFSGTVAIVAPTFDLYTVGFAARGFCSLVIPHIVLSQIPLFGSTAVGSDDTDMADLVAGDPETINMVAEFVGLDTLLQDIGTRKPAVVLKVFLKLMAVVSVDRVVVISENSDLSTVFVPKIVVAYPAVNENTFIVDKGTFALS